MMVNRMLCVVVGVSFVASAFATDVRATWSSSEKTPSLADGAVTFYYDGGGKVTEIKATPADGSTIWLSGDKLELAASATITVASEGRLQFSNEVSCAGDVCISGSGETELEWNKGQKTLLPTNTFATMFANMNLDDWEPVAFRGDLVENRPASCSFPNRFDATYCRRETVGGEKRMTVDLVYKSGASRTAKFIRILLVQDGASVKGKTLAAWNADNSPKTSDSIDEELLDPDSDVAPIGLATDDAVKGRFGVTQLTMRRVRPASIVRFDGTVSNMPNGKRFKVSATATVEGDIGHVTAATATPTTPNVEANGAFEYWAVAKGVSYLRSALTGAGSVCVRGSEPIVRVNNDSVFEEFSKSGYINEQKAAWLADDRFAVDITNAVAMFAGTEGGTTSATLLPAQLCHLKPDNASGTHQMAQFQAVTNGLIKCAYVRFSHQDNGIDNVCLYAQLVSAWSLPNEPPYSLGVDFDDCKSSATQLSVTNGSLTAKGLCVYNTRLYFAKPRASRLYGRMRADAANSMTGSARLIVEGSDERTVRFLAVHTNTLPASGTVEIRNGGDLHLVSAGMTGKGYNGGKAKIFVRTGGLLRQYTSNPVGDDQKVFLDGGEMLTGYLQAIDGDGSYFQFLTFKDGARVYGNPIRVGIRRDAPFYTVCGSKPSALDSDLVLAANTDSTFQLRVADVTGDSEPDFVINGDFRHSDANTSMTVAKYGPGTVRMNGRHRQRRPVEIHAGTWCLGESNMTCTDAENPSDFVLCGGRLAAAAGTVNTIGTLSANGSGTIEIGDGAKMSVSALDLSGATENIIIAADLSKESLRIGDGTASVPPESLRRLKQFSNGKYRSVHVDANGWVREGGYGFVLVVQ